MFDFTHIHKWLENMHPTNPTMQLSSGKLTHKGNQFDKNFFLNLKNKLLGPDFWQKAVNL